MFCSHIKYIKKHIKNVLTLKKAYGIITMAERLVFYKPFFYSGYPD
jgi:hypothetical protein